MKKNKVYNTSDVGLNIHEQEAMKIQTWLQKLSTPMKFNSLAKFSTNMSVYTGKMLIKLIKYNMLQRSTLPGTVLC